MPFMNFALGETVEMLREAVSDFAEREIAPKAAIIDSENHFPSELWPKLGQLGLLGVTVDEEYGGSGLGYLEHVIAMEEISRASASVGFKLWCSFQSVRKSNSFKWYKRAKTTLST